MCVPKCSTAFTMSVFNELSKVLQTAAIPKFMKIGQKMYRTKKKFHLPPQVKYAIPHIKFHETSHIQKSVNMHT